MATPKPVRIYMDYQASTPADPRVVSEMAPYWSDFFGNPHSSEHSFGWQAHEAIQSSRSQIASLVGAEPDEIIFTSGATEANNLAVLGIARAMTPDRRRIIISSIEHKCVIAAALEASRKGFELVSIPVGHDGIVDPSIVENLVDSKTALVSIMAVNNEIGTIQPLYEISQICHRVGALFHTDASQALTAQKINVEELDTDLMSLSAHKMYGPKGIGAIFIRRDLSIKPNPIIYGGGQENGFRSGTLPTPLCVGFGKSCSIIGAEGESDIYRISNLRNQFLAALLSYNIDLTVNGTMHLRHPGNLNILFHNIDANILLSSIQPMIAASTGSACSSGIPSASHVLKAIGLSAKDANSSIRFSIGRFTTHDDVISAAHIIHDELIHIQC